MATKYLGSNSLLYLLNLIKTKFDTKVDKETGKGLSTNDYTTAEKTKLAGIEEGANKYTLPTAAKDTLGGVKTTSTVTSASGYTASPIISGVPYYKDTTYAVATTSANGLMSASDKTKLNGIDTGAEVNVIETVKVNGTAQTVSGKAVDITVPTKTSSLTNDSGYITSDDVPVTSVNGDTGDIETTRTASIQFNSTAALAEGTTGISDMTAAEIVQDYAHHFAIHAYVSGAGKGEIAALPLSKRNYGTNVVTFAGTYYDEDEDCTYFMEISVNGTVATVTSYFKVADETAVGDKLDNKVDKVSGKGLSTNDYTTAEKTKLSGIATGAQVNVIESIKVNGTAQTISSKAVNITVPTKVSQLTNDSSYATQTYVDEAIGGITGMSYSVVSTLPSTGKAGVIYLVPKTAETKDIYNEYIWVNNAFELIGTTAPDLSGYVKTTDLVELTNTEVQAIWDEA